MCWKLLRDDKKQDIPLSANDLFEQFKQLSSTIDSCVCCDTILEGSTPLDQTPNTTVLNKEIEEKEMNICIAKFKTNNSVGIDKILNEDIKSTEDIMMSLDLKPFYKVLNSVINV